ncbi:hypothetical protein DUI87_18139 [Hirundo rustica rustica]|uniref:Uncharacterized protein n=1 Tax=Hirundo rustica rustica TaxID=333673 RepID=A0A3M0JVU4_HIRRU|nr:hypothetical protein DUI87_18139 [Hirundo rustica rustica]
MKEREEPQRRSPRSRLIQRPESSVTGKGFSSLQQRSTELESELFTPIKPLYYLSDRSSAEEDLEVLEKKAEPSQQCVPVAMKTTFSKQDCGQQINGCD